MRYSHEIHIRFKTCCGIDGDRRRDVWGNRHCARSNWHSQKIRRLLEPGHPHIRQRFSKGLRNLTRVRVTCLWERPGSRLCKITRGRHALIWERLIKRLFKVARIELNQPRDGQGIEFFARLQHLGNLGRIRRTLNTALALKNSLGASQLSPLIRGFRRYWVKAPGCFIPVRFSI